MTTSTTQPAYTYERPDEKPYKHESDSSEAHFITVRGLRVGKCPKGLAVKEAARLLADAIPFGEDRGGHPRHFFAVHQGVPYTTKWTSRGRSVHGFPWCFREPPGMPKEIRDKLRDRAEQAGYADAFDDWMKKYGRSPEVRE